MRGKLRAVRWAVRRADMRPAGRLDKVRAGFDREMGRALP